MCQLWPGRGKCLDEADDKGLGMCDKLSAKDQLMNSFTATLSIWNALALLQAQITTRQAWRPVKYTVTGGMSSGQIAQDALWAYGIDTVLWTIEKGCEDGQPVMHVTKYVPGKMYWMADHLLRKYALATGAFRVDSPPVMRDGKSSAHGITPKMWQPWGVPAKSKSFDSGFSRMIGLSFGNDMNASFKRLARHGAELKRDVKQMMKGK